MSCSPVRGLMNAVPFWYAAGSTLWSIVIVTRATPLTSCTFVISPTLTPATVTSSPCPGVSACAFAKSAWIV